MSDTEAGCETATLGGPTTYMSHTVARPCAPPAVTDYGGRCHHHHPITDCGEDFEYGRKTYNSYIEVF
jgi:hypothetical protein